MSGQRRLHVDIETRSSIDLRKHGVYRYVEAADFEIMLIAFALDGEPVRLIDYLLGDKEELGNFLALLSDASVLKSAFNAQFERTCLAKFFDFYPDPEDWECTMAHAYSLGIPGTLGEVGDRLGIKEDKKKWSDGRKMIRTFCVPDKKTGRFIDPATLPEEWGRFRGYCLQDVEAEREIAKRLALFPLPDEERRLWHLDQRMNDRGVRIDTRLAKAAIAGATTEIDRLEAEAVSITGLANPRSRTQLLDWLRAAQIEEGLEESLDLKKKTVQKLLRTEQPLLIESVLRLRQEISKSSIAKYAAMLRGVCADGRLRGLLQYYGAIRTGRWAGRQVQAQNLPRNEIKDLREMRAALLIDPASISVFYESVLTVLSELIRTAFIPAPGKKLISVDFSAIEARVIAWFAWEQWRLDVFNSHGKIYEASAEQMFRLPAGSVSKGSPLRQKGKIAELALGFQGGVGALEVMGALDMGLTRDELPDIKVRWREASPSIVCLWWAMEEAARTAVLRRDTEIEVWPIMSRIVERRGLPPLPAHAGVSRVSFKREAGMLFMRLPSGRRLAYPHPRVEEGDFGPKVTFMGLHPITHKWARIDTFGGKLVENLVQATARDCLREALFDVEEAGYAAAFSVHDEIVLEVDERDAEKICANVLERMAEPVHWAPELPLKATGDVLDFYMKA